MQVPCKITPVGDKIYARNFVGAAQSQLRILENQMTFGDLKQGVRRVRLNPRTVVTAMVCFNLREVIIDCLPVRKVEKGKRFEEFSKLYIYVTISNYVTIWDLLTGEVAEDVSDNEGHVNDENGNPLITFPCHKDKLVGWLKGIKDRPTRQVLKDNPEDNRDYLIDNHKDMGNENRLLVAMEKDPSYVCYYGLKKPVNFLNYTQDINDECEPYYCITCDPDNHPCTVPHLGGCSIYIANEYDTVATSGPMANNMSFKYANLRAHVYDCYQHPQLIDCWYIWRSCQRGHNIISKPEYTQKYFKKSKHLYLCTYPGPCYYPNPFSDLCVGYCTPEDSRYEKPVDIEADHTYFYCMHETLLLPGAYINYFKKSGDSFSIKTMLGNLIIDNTPTRDREDQDEFYKIIQAAATNGDCLDIAVPDNLYLSTRDFEQGPDVFGDQVISGDEPSHAFGKNAWYRNEDRQTETDTLPGESTRTAVTWCGNRYDYRYPQVTGWYRVLLCFHMEEQYTSGKEYFYNAANLPDDPVSELTEWEDHSPERFSSVQATIEMECPEDYPKERNVPIPDNPSAIRYKRPEDYSSLCAFPSRDCGYPEDEENNICFPFDGTYDIFTLGEAVEKLINDHYEDGSNDQMSVYLYERPDMIEKEVEV